MSRPRTAGLPRHAITRGASASSECKVSDSHPVDYCNSVLSLLGDKNLILLICEYMRDLTYFLGHREASINGKNPFSGPWRLKQKSGKFGNDIGNDFGIRFSLELLVDLESAYFCSHSIRLYCRPTIAAVWNIMHIGGKNVRSVCPGKPRHLVSASEPFADSISGVEVPYILPSCES